MKIYSVTDELFKKYGQVLEGYDFGKLFQALEETPCPKDDITYVASVPELENCETFRELMQRGFGGMPIQIGYCNGSNSTLNCLEYHKNSEFNIPKNDIVLLLGLESEIEDGLFDTAKVKAFHIPAGIGVELYGTTLHYAPCDYQKGDGFRMLCVLPRGTNEKISAITCKGEEDKRLFAKNKWLLVHPDAKEAKEGGYVGLKGENITYR